MDMSTNKSVHLLTLAASPDGTVQAQEQGRPHSAVAVDVEGAVAQAIHRPGARFRSSYDELEATRAALRGRALMVQVRNGEICTLGLR